MKIDCEYGVMSFLELMLCLMFFIVKGSFVMDKLLFMFGWGFIFCYCLDECFFFVDGGVMDLFFLMSVDWFIWNILVFFE